MSYGTQLHDVLRCTMSYRCVCCVCQDYTCWCDMRQLETLVGQRYLTHESDDSRWEQHRTEHSCRPWRDVGHQGATKNDWSSFNRAARGVSRDVSSSATSGGYKS